MANKLEQEVIDAARAGIGVDRPGVDWFNHQDDRKRLAAALDALDASAKAAAVPMCADCGWPESAHRRNIYACSTFRMP